MGSPKQSTSQDKKPMRKISHQPFLVQTQCKKFHITHSQYELNVKNFASPFLTAKIFTPPILNVKIFRINNSQCENFRITILHKKFQFHISSHPFASTKH